MLLLKWLWSLVFFKGHEESARAQKLIGLPAKQYNRKRYLEKVQMKKNIRLHNESIHKKKVDTPKDGDALPAYLLDRENVSRAKVLSNTIKQKRKEKAGKWSVPLPRVKPISEDEMFRVVKTGKRKKKQWKRMVTKVTYVGDSFVRKPPKYERFIRPTGLRFKKAHVTHPELKTTFFLDIIGKSFHLSHFHSYLLRQGVKKNPSSLTYTTLGVITKGTIIEVNVSDLGLVTPNGKVVFGKYAQVTNNPENDGCINSVLLV